jgi:hypothetical protein
LVLAAEQATGAVGGQPRGLLEGPIGEKNAASAVEEENGVLSALEQGLPAYRPPWGLAHGQK